MKKFVLLIVATIATILIVNAQTTIIDNQKPSNSQIEILGENNNEITLKLATNFLIVSIFFITLIMKI